jgi:hypothetical protein
LLDKTHDVIASTLLSLHHNADVARSLRRFQVRRFAPVSEDDYR